MSNQYSSVRKKKAKMLFHLLDKEDGKSLSEFSETSGDGDVENTVIFSDPESEWSAPLAKESASSLCESDTRPESDQRRKSSK